MAAIREAREVFGPDFASRWCFFHLCQSTHRKVGELGLINRYRTDDAFRKACGMLDGLAFVAPDLVPSGLPHIRDMAPDDMAEILAYFDSTYVSGTFRTLSRAGADGRLTTPVRRRCPEFPPELWNVMEATLRGEDRTNNACEGGTTPLNTSLGILIRVFGGSSSACSKTKRSPVQPYCKSAVERRLLRRQQADCKTDYTTSA
ncbi:unnamed protein product [Ixodes persulcatus]